MQASASVLLFSLIAVLPAQAQQQVDAIYFETFGGVEVTVDFETFDRSLLNNDLVLDHGCTHQDLHLYATEEGYAQLLASGTPHQLRLRKSTSVKVKGVDEILSLKNPADCLPVMDFYPTYTAYVEMMENFENEYPELCEIIEIGTLQSGRKLLVAHIGDDLGSDDNEPDFLYTSTMHGDEIAGFPLMLQLIDHLLCNYDTSEEIKNLVDNIDIYINPISNPDGTYGNDDETIENPRRRNANNVDLNRNYPDPEDGDQPDNRPRQDESQFFMDFADSIDFDMSANFHGGAEVANYPWDTYQRLPADTDWWIEKMRDYANSAQANSPDGYMDGFDDGITNGFEWFEVRGGRQDYMNFFQRCREFTVELSNMKVLPADELPLIWEANRQALLDYMEASLNGLRGVITDCMTGDPIVAEVLIPGHDMDNSSVFSQADLGNFHRYLDGGTYQVEVVAEGYQTAIQTIDIVDGETTLWDVALCTEGTSTSEIGESIWEITQSPTELQITGLIHQDVEATLYDMGGQRLLSTKGQSRLSTAELNPGIYIVKVLDESHRLVKSIHVK